MDTKFCPFWGFQISSLIIIFVCSFHSFKFVEEKSFTFELLSDPGNEVAQLYGIKYTLPNNLKQVYLKFGIDLPKYNADDSWTLPLPTRLIIDQDGIIRYGEINADYTVRPDPEVTLEALKKIIE